MFQITLLAPLESIENSFLAHSGLTFTVSLHGGSNKEGSGISFMTALIPFLRTESDQLLKTQSRRVDTGNESLRCRYHSIYSKSGSIAP